jgi:polyisoprenyl-phosphate glycosyltransferase
MKKKRKLLSVVVPVYFQEKGLHELHRRLTAALTKITDMDYEIILVNDGSTDRSFEIMKDIHANDEKVKVINFSRNFNQQMALTAGLDHAHGDAIVIIDDDLQDPPEIIEKMVEKWREGFKVVYGVRSKRRGESTFKLLTAKIFYRVVNRLSDIEIPIDSGDFRLLDRVVVNALRSMKEESRYLRGLVAWIGYSQCAVEYERAPRFAGTTNYNLRSLLRFAANGITSFSERPLYISVYIGAIVTIVSVLFLIAMIIVRLTAPQFTIAGWTSTIGVIIFFGGIQLISLGIIGQYIGRIYREIKGRPLYIISEEYGFEGEERTDRRHGTSSL